MPEETILFRSVSDDEVQFLDDFRDGLDGPENREFEMPIWLTEIISVSFPFEEVHVPQLQEHELKDLPFEEIHTFSLPAIELQEQRVIHRKNPIPIEQLIIPEKQRSYDDIFTKIYLNDLMIESHQAEIEILNEDLAYFDPTFRVLQGSTPPSSSFP